MGKVIIITIISIMNKQKHYVSKALPYIHMHIQPTVEEETTQLLTRCSLLDLHSPSPFLTFFAHMIARPPAYFFPAAPPAEFTFSTNHSIPKKY